MTFSPFDLRSKNLFKRCVQCNPLTSAQCPPCKADEVCTLIPVSCERCPEYTCQSAVESGAIDLKTTPVEHKSPAAAIAGGVIGGVVLISIMSYVIWRFVLKGKRHEPVEEFDPMDYPMEKPGEMTAFSRDARSRASTHTVTSMASTVLTRASNVIQIAFIPGVTTRQQGQAETPNTLVPPVPPIPIPTNRESDADLMFMPGDLRDSAYTDVSAFGNSTRKSLAPSLARTSIASTIYKENAVAVSAIKPHIVSVSKNGTPVSSPGLHTPPVPSIDMNKFGQAGASVQKPMLVQMPVSREHNRATGGPSPVGSVRGLKPKAVTISKGKPFANSSASTSSSPTLLDGGSSQASTPDKRPSASSPLARVQSQASEPDSTHGRARRGMDESDVSDDESSLHERSRKSLMRKVSSPFSDSAAVDTKSTTSLSSSRKGSNNDSPFDDRNRL